MPTKVKDNENNRLKNNICFGDLAKILAIQAGKINKAETKNTPTIFKANAINKPKTTVVQNLIFATAMCCVFAKSSLITINKISLKK